MNDPLSNFDRSMHIALMLGGTGMMVYAAEAVDIGRFTSREIMVNYFGEVLTDFIRKNRFDRSITGYVSLQFALESHRASKISHSG